MLFILGSLAKCIVDFLLVLLEPFHQVLHLRRYERKLIKNRRFKGTGSVWPKVSGTRGRHPPTILPLEN